MLRKDIDKVNQTIKKQINSHSIDPNFKRILNDINQLLTASKNGEDEVKLQEALVYLKMVRWGGFLKTKTLGEYLKKNDELTEIKDPQLELAVKQKYHSQLSKKLTDHERDFLVQIFRGVQDNLENTWTYSYPKNSDGEIMNPAIGVWQNHQMPLRAPESALRDFTRDFTIEEQAFKKDEKVDDVKDRIHKLVENSAYESSMKPLISEWLLSNGGQDNNRFVDQCFMDDHFTDKTNDGMNYGVGSSKSLESDWSLNDDNKIVFNYKVLIYTVTKGSSEIIMRDENNNAKKTTDDREIEQAMMRKSDPNKPDTRSPLMQIKAQIELDIATINGKAFVKPKIIQYDVASSTNYLKSPGRLNLNHEIPPPSRRP